MDNQQLLAYLRQQLQNGKTKEQITQELINGGWKQEDIDRGFTSLNSGMPVPETLELPKATKIFSEAWQIYKQGYPTFILINSIPIISVALLGLVGGIGIFSGKFLNFNLGDFNIPAIIIAVLILIILAIYISLWSSVAQIYAIKNHSQNYSWKTAFIDSKDKIGAFFVTSLLAALAVIGGTILLIIPGIIFAIWFSQVAYIVVEEDLAGASALKRSKYYIKGRALQVLGKIFFMGIISLGLFILTSIVIGILTSILGENGKFLSLLNNLFSLIWTPMTVIFAYQLYKHLKHTRP